VELSAALPSEPAARRLSEFTTLISTATPRTIVDFVETHFAADYAQREPVERRIRTFMDWKARGGFDILESVIARPDYIETIARHPVSNEYWRLGIEVETVPPHRYKAVLLGRSPLPPRHEPPREDEAAEEFLSYMERLAQNDLFSGCILMARHGHVLAERAFGFSNRDFDIANNPGTRFNVASLTKSWTAVAVCQLVEAGRLDLEDPLANYLPYPDAEAASRIKIKHLLSHTADLGSYFTPEFDRTSRRNMRSVDDFLALTKDQYPEVPPGTRWKYSNTGMVVLGKIIEVICGRSYFDVVCDNVLRPAGMLDSGFPELDFANRNLAVGYDKVWSLEGPRMANSLFEGVVRGGPAGCGYATARDVFRFAEAFRSGKLVSREMVELMSSAKPELKSPNYGYGFSIHPERALFGHSGGLIGASSNLDIALNPDGWVVIVLANDLSMRAPVLKARQIIGVTVAEADEGRAYLPRAGLTAR